MGQVLSNVQDLLANIFALPQCKDVISSFQISDGHLMESNHCRLALHISISFEYYIHSYPP